MAKRGTKIATRWNIVGDLGTIDFYKDMAAATWTTSREKRVYCEAWYEF